MTLRPAPAPATEDGAALDLDDLVAEARARLRRPSPAEAARAVAEDGALLVDIRPEAQRRREGEIPGAVIIDRNVLEWRLAPGSEHRIPELRHPDQPVIVFCSGGFASSLAAASLQRLGLTGATDLDGGFQAWDADGRPTVPFGWHNRVDRTLPVRRPASPEEGTAIRTA
jgi:rhodanese-related sulfurtransferase